MITREDLLTLRNGGDQEAYRAALGQYLRGRDKAAIQRDDARRRANEAASRAGRQQRANSFSRDVDLRNIYRRASNRKQQPDYIENFLRQFRVDDRMQTVGNL